ncbi:zinc finger protein 2 isoform X2 [Eupeodes corollae]|nr:zinc finger protein 2 isoform X2 [Eupeodes corollae]XP_055922639.1 zinc finger protein 2 isoform X2 [Eupeodes corollae]
MSCSDVESFQGKIVYNPDGSAYIIDSENESLSNIPENCISAGSTTTTNNPKIHSFRVVTARDACVNISELNKIQKPILMCFICKLSFGNTKSFSLHANSEHTLNLQESEKLLLNREYSSAIIQRNVDEKPQISFLEPLDIQKQNQLNKLASPQKQQQQHPQLHQQQQQQQQQQLLISSTSSISSSTVNSNNSCSNSISSSNLPTTLSSSSSTSVGTVSTVTVAAAAAAAAANAALVAAIAASCSNTSLNTSTSLSMNAPHIDSDSIMASLGGAAGGNSNTNTNSSYGNTTGTLSNNPSNNSSNCSQIKNHQQQRSDNFDNLSTLDLSAVTAAAQAAAATSIVNSRHTPPPSSPTSTTSSSPSSSSSSASTLSLSAQQPSTTISASGLPAPTSTITNELKPLHSLAIAMDTISSTFASSSPATKLSSINSTISVSNTLSNKNNSSALLPPTPTTVADFLHQQFQHMQNQIRITSPASSIGVSASGCNSEINAQSSSITTSAPSLGSLTASLAAAAAAVGSGSTTDLSSSNSGVKLINDFLQHQFQQQQQQQQQQQHTSFSTCPEHPDVKGIDCKTCEMIEINIKSPMTPIRSPNNINMFPSNVTLSPTAAAAPSFTIGACPEHINGRPLGVDCSRCEMILNSARLNSGVQMSTRNSCKTLKCPQCNWHYKYQETLEIHMREKHPDGESACGYCLAGQQHPRLARGESYTCGYKPYRCEICNYSTTTKGNLSIHMQSDKHLNNMQELNSSQNMANTTAEIRESPKIIMPNIQQQASKPKPSFRCDVCSYETSVARNLRIHMTSEKHTHNMAVLQNNIKHIQAFNFLQSQNLGQLSAAQNAAVAASNLPNISNLQNFLPEAALADIAYNQALMIQLLHQNSAAGALSAAAAAVSSPLTLPPPQQSPASTGVLVSQPQTTTTPTSQQPPQQSYHSSLTSSKLNHQTSPQQNMPTVVTTAAPPISTSSITTSSHLSSSQQHSAVAAAALLAEAAAAAAAATSSDPASICLQQQQQQQQQLQQQDASLDPPIDPDPKPTTAFSCLICANYNTNSIDELNNHLMIDRSRNTNNNCSDIMMIINNNYICRLCNYKTNLKANFQLHSKTDKHLQKLNYINHIREGGVKNEYKLKYSQTNTVQLKCNCCDFYTNSIQKLNLHTQHMRHDTMKMIFNHLLFLVNSFNVSLGSDALAVCSENSEYQLMSKNKVIMCQLCNFSAVNILQVVQHVKSLRHIQVEQFICLQRRSENLESLGLDDIFKIADSTDHIKSERSSPAQSLESQQLFVKQEIEKSSPMTATTITSTTTTTTTKTTADSPAPEAVTTPTTSTGPTKTRHDIYTESASDLQQTVSSSSNTVSKSSNCNNELADVDLSSLPSIIYKCNNCDYFAQAKSEMQNHIANIHLNVSDEDFLTIPTNPAALHAFHAAVAAAAVAVAENAAASQSRRKSSSPVHLHMQDDGQQQQHHHHDQMFGSSERGNELMAQVKTEQMDIMDDAQSNDECGQLEDPIELLSSRNSANVTSSPAVNSVMCPLCQDSFNEKKAFEMHLMGVHSVNNDGLARLLQLVDNSHWLNTSRRSSTSTTPEPRNSSTPLSEAGGQLGLQHPQQQQQKQQQNLGTSPVNQHASNEDYACSQCGITFKLQQHLLMHANDAQHYQMVNEQYQCLSKHCQQLFGNSLQMLTHYKDSHMNIVISERHVYKYRCKQCSLAFKTQEKLNTHSLYHTMRDATKCMICNRNFRSTQSLQKHMEQAHSQAQPSGSPVSSPNSSGEITNASGSLPVTPLVKAGDEDVSANAAVTTSMNSGATTGATTSTVCSDSNSLSPVTGESAAIANESSSIVPPAAPTSPNPSAVTAVAAALLKQQQQQQSLTPELVQKLNLDPTILAQKIMEQNFSNFPPNFPGLPQNLQSLQSLQNLQNMQQNLPNMGNMPMNTLDMLNLMQFHHLMSLNFMNLAPPLIFGAGGAGPSPSVTGTKTTTTSDLPPTTPTQIIQQQTSTPSQNTNNQKRARTRITDDQLKILRAHFDINNSPSEESIMEMSKKANLPMKVVKHWFRNTLFKERQRNKDSPYNFNNPPSTTLNLEEYERTGQTKVTPLSESGGGNISGFHIQHQQQQREQQQRDQQQRDHQHQQIQQHQQQLQQQIQSQHLQQQHRPPSSQSSDLNFPQLSFHQQQPDLSRQQSHQQQDNRPLSHPSSVTSDRGDIHIKPEPTDDIGSSDCDQQMAMSKDNDNEQSMMQTHHQQSMFYNNFETKSESGSSEILSRPQTPNSTSTPYSSNISDILGQQMDSLPLNNMANISNLNNMGPPKKFQMSKMFEKSGNFETNSNSSNSSTSSGKRANRTRFTDYQIKVLQEFFENNSYPKDSDLEYLSKLLLLSPRVIVVWFQNARQKQRKIYENQPNNTFYESEEKKPNINYACKKCNLVFQRYYELIRHQKNHCFKEENNKKSAKAQIAAAQIAQSLSSEDSNSSIDINSANILSSGLVGPQAAAAAAAVAVAAAAVGGGGGTAIPPVMPGLASSPGINLLASPQHIFKQQQAVTSAGGTHVDSNSPLQKFECEKCQLVFNRYELYKEHQLIHLMNPNLFMNQNYSEVSPFGILQNLQGSHNNQQDISIDLSRQKKRKYSDTQASPEEMHHQQTDYEAFNKKFKNDQYEFLYQYFLQNDSNADLKNQFQQQQQQPDMDLEYLNNFYQQNELKKRSNYDFLLQYYMRNESKQSSNASSLMLLNDDANKPNMEFLLQYYQLTESKKFFQLEASPQRIHDFPPLLNLTMNAAATKVNNGVSAQQHLEQSQVSVTPPTETTPIKANPNVTPSSPSSSPVRQQSSNSGCGVGNKDTSTNKNSSSKHFQVQPTLLAENDNLLSASVAVAAAGGGSGGTNNNIDNYDTECNKY